MDNTYSLIFVGPISIYLVWFLFLVKKFRSRNIKRKAILRYELRRTRVLITIALLMFSVITSGLMWVVPLIQKQRLFTGSEILIFFMVCPVGLWFSSMFVLWSYTTGWRIIDSEEEE